MLLSSPAPFGDHAEPTFEEDAAGALRFALLRIKRESGHVIHDCAGRVIAALGQADGNMADADLERAVIFELELGPGELRFPGYAIDVLERLSVVSVKGDRVYLNPAVSEAVTRELFR